MGPPEPGKFGFVLGTITKNKVVDNVNPNANDVAALSWAGSDEVASRRATQAEADKRSSSASKSPNEETAPDRTAEGDSSKQSAPASSPSAASSPTADPSPPAPTPVAPPVQPASSAAPPSAPQTPKRRNSAAQNAKDAKEAGLTDLEKGRVGVQTHNTSPKVKAAEGTSATHESAHLVPQAVYRQLGGSPGRALTVNLPAPIHKQIDQGWVPQWNAAIKSGREITAGDVQRWVSDAIQRLSNTTLSPAAKGTLQWKLELELHQLGLNSSSVIVPRKQSSP